MYNCIICSKSFLTSGGHNSHQQIHQPDFLIKKQNNIKQSHITQQSNRDIQMNEYLQNPTLCNHCQLPLSYIKRKNKFCSNSCSASFNNTAKGRKCPVPIPSIFVRGVSYTKVQYKTCSNCDNMFWSHASPNKHLPTTCSDSCFLQVKKHNALGIKRQIYNGITFDSKWEVQMVKLLDNNLIKWIIPKTAIMWIDSSGKLRKYFPDFYLPDYNVYIDPKNPLVISLQQEKLDKVSNIITLKYGSPLDILAWLEGLEPTCIL